MQINWSQLITNILGFLLLYWGLRRWAWGPILAMLDERRARIQRNFDEIQQQQEENQVLKATLESQLREVEGTARKRIEEATAEGNRLAGEIKEDARTQARAMLDKARVDIDHERAKARVALRNDIVAMAVSGAERILRREIETEGPERMVDRFIDDVEGSNA